MLIASQHPMAHLDIQIDDDGRRSAIELKYLVRAFEGEYDGEHFELPNRGAHDISRYDVVKDIARVELLLRDGFGREVLYIAEIEKPSPAAGEVLVEVKAAGINPGEVSIRSGALEAALDGLRP
jgi:hypothetical protein